MESREDGTAPEGSPVYKTLRNGKRILQLQTPASKGAARVAVEAPATTSKKASRVPVAQVTC